MRYAPGERSGPDGSDHIHREKVSSQYKTSASNKRKLKFMLVISFASCLPLLLHIFQIKFGIWKSNYVLPSVETWEYFYLATLFLTIIAWMCLKKNRANLLMFYLFCSSFLSIIPLLFAAVTHIPELSTLISKKTARLYLFGFPFPALLYAFLSFAVACNSYAVYLASKLIQAWTTKGYKSN